MEGSPELRKIQRPLETRGIPKDIPNSETFVRAHWDILLSILERHWSELREVKSRYPKGPRTTLERAEKFFERTHRYLVSLTQCDIPPPELQFLPFNKQLARSTLIFSTVVSSLAGVLFYVTLAAHTRGILSQGETVLLLLPTCSLLYLPIPLHRRTRINMEHSCRYLREGGKGHIVIGDVREGMFISFCAHEMAHHFLRERGRGGGLWEEGWARWIQLRVSEALSREYSVDALTPALTLLLGELKEALMLARGDRPIPAWVRKVKSPFHTGAFTRWVKGEPSHSRERLFVHALGTAAFALLNEFRGDDIFKEFIGDKKPYPQL
ncbi:MAG TPA: hypothetical protein ENF32_05630 [Thermosulfidibacter takaii]|uniref:Uncharacterized protein n=1 Tax=Thermosulfidibacter takaii TaxID=412593 RepID=A0A7C0U769_9BACT|nr:hypothetical protein [Thermosulfidibacter takaii]